MVTTNQFLHSSNLVKSECSSSQDAANRMLKSTESAIGLFFPSYSQNRQELKLVKLVSLLVEGMNSFHTQPNVTNIKIKVKKSVAFAT